MQYQPDWIALKPRIIAASKLPTEREFYLQILRDKKGDGGAAHKARLIEIFQRQGMDYYFHETLLPERDADNIDAPF